MEDAFLISIFAAATVAGVVLVYLIAEPPHDPKVKTCSVPTSGSYSVWSHCALCNARLELDHCEPETCPKDGGDWLFYFKPCRCLMDECYTPCNENLSQAFNSI